MHIKNIQTGGKPLKEAEKVLVMIHGRGARAEDILRLATHLNLQEYALVAPQASNQTWYPYSFMATQEQNEPWLSFALDLLYEVREDISKKGIKTENIYFLGFSQGACLALEFVTRNATRYGGVVAFTGGLIGDKIYNGNYSGDFKGTPVFIGTGVPDPHVPEERVKESKIILERMNADVKLNIFENKPHTVSREELDLANQWVFKD